MGTLGTPSGSPASRRPHAVGEAEGILAGTPVVYTVEWLVDTGAEVAVVQDRVGQCFDLSPTGATATGTTGGRAILMTRGMTVHVPTEDAMGGLSVRGSSRDVGVKSDNTGSNLVGVDQLADCGVTVEWDPLQRSGRLLR